MYYRIDFEGFYFSTQTICGTGVVCVLRKWSDKESQNCDGIHESNMLVFWVPHVL